MFAFETALHKIYLLKSTNKVKIRLLIVTVFKSGRMPNIRRTRSVKSGLNLVRIFSEDPSKYRHMTETDLKMSSTISAPDINMTETE